MRRSHPKPARAEQAWRPTVMTFAGRRRDRHQGRWTGPLLATLLGVSGCATYADLPLGAGRGAPDVAALTAPTASLALPLPATHRFDPADGLDVTEVAMLAVVNSPQLRGKRDELGIANAQAFAAGLLPDPQLALSADFPHPRARGLSTGYSLGLSEDIDALLTRSSRTAAARGHVRQVNLDLLWAEWQTLAQARLLFDQTWNLREQRTLLEREQAPLAEVAGNIRAALQAGDLSYDSASAGLNAQADLRKRLADNAVALHQADAELHLLLGLAPAAPLPLVGAPYRATPTAAELNVALDTLPQRRPDLLALQAGYASQQEKLRAAILAQFPALNIGFNTARDTSAVDTHGLSIGITLPLFDRNRGNMAIERATRAQLHDDYTARVLTTRSDIRRIDADLATLDTQVDQLQTHVHELDQARDAADRAWRAGALDWPTWLAIRSNALAADLDLLATRQERARQSIALETLLGRSDLAVPDPSTAKAAAR